jgi:hypothetical protein
MTTVFLQLCCSAAGRRLKQACFVAFAPFVEHRRAQWTASKNKNKGDDGFLTLARHNIRVAYNRA